MHRLLLILFLFFSFFVSSQNSFELHGKIKVEESNISAVRIVVTKNGQTYKTLRPDASGKYSFNLDYNNKYIVAFQKNGFVTKRVEVNTYVTNEVLEDDSYKYKWKVDVGLFREYDGIDFSFFEKPISKIFFVEKNGRFDADYKYAKQIEKELKAKIAEVEKRKLEEAKQAEIERKAEATRQKQEQQARLNAQNKPKPQEEFPPITKPKPTYTQPKPKKRVTVNVVENKEVSTETYSDKYKVVVYKTVVIGKQVDVYRQVNWSWGPTYYFKNSNNISYHIFYQDTKID